MSDVKQTFKKRMLALRYFLIGRGYFKAVEALEFASHYHCGTRKDGVTPEFFHQVSIASYVRTLPVPTQDMEDLITAVLLHDVCEDYNVSFDVIRQHFGVRVTEIVRLMTNQENGIKKLKVAYYGHLARDPLGAIGKGSDRIHNFQSMVGVFSEEKQKNYISEAEEFIIPMLKQARRQFPAYEAAFENIKLVMESQIHLIRATFNE